MKGYIVEDENKPRYKQVIILRKDLKMGCGKAIAQGCHASVEARSEAIRLDDDGRERGVIVDEWERAGYHKVILAAPTEDVLVSIYRDAKKMRLPTVLIEDFGLTQLDPGTKTAVGIGPARVEDLNKVAGHLKLY